MTGHQPANPGYDDAELGRVVNTAMSGILAKLEAAFDPAAGLADIHARRTADSSRLAAVCDQVDLLGAWLADVVRAGQRSPFAGSSYLDLARDNLVQLRAGLASRTMARPKPGSSPATSVTSSARPTASCAPGTGARSTTWPALTRAAAGP